MVLMHWVQTFMRTVLPSMMNFRRWMFGLKVREVRGALRFQRPECLWRMLRPKTVCLPQS